MNIRTVLLSALLATAMVSPASAQFLKESERAFRNLRNIDNLITRAGAAAGRASTESLRVSIPDGILKGNYTVLTAAQLPAQITPANASLAYQYANMSKSDARNRLQDDLLNYPLQEAWLLSGGQGFYQNQSQLAHALDFFYDGRGVTRKFGRKTVKLYTLPVEGILYKPVGYTDPVLLNSDAYFVVYEPDTQTGQLVENTPEMLRLFSEPGNSDTFAATTSEPNAPLTIAQQLQVNQIRIAQMRAAHQYDHLWKALGFPKVYTSQDQLGRTLSDFYRDDEIPQLRKRFSNDICLIYEFPVEGIQYAPVGRTPITLNPETQVVLYIKGVGGQIIDRVNLTNPLYFEPISEE